MKYLIIAALAVLAFALGHDAGKRSIRRQIAKATDRFIRELGTLADKVKANPAFVPRPDVTKPAFVSQPQAPRPTPMDDVLAREVVPILRPGDMDRALSRGDVALFYPRDGNS